MAIRITVLPAAVARMREGGGPVIIQALVSKMNALMIALQAKIVGETIPRFFPAGASNIPATVRTIPAELQGTKIVGSVQAGGPRTTKVTLKSGREVDYAGVQEYGIDHQFLIEPFDKKVLSFIWNGKRVFFAHVTHPGLKPRPYMRYALEEMSPDIKEGLQQALVDALNG